MKTRNFFLPILSVLLFPAFSFAQQKIDLMIVVETNTITQDNIAETCRFENQPDGTSILDYITYVSMGDEIKWRVDRADDNKGSVKLVKFKHENGTKFFNKDTIPEKNGRIKGTIVNGNDDEVEKYTIEIKVKKKDENDWTNYIIDPKLQMRAQE